MSDGACIIYKDGVFCVGFKRRVTPNNMVQWRWARDRPVRWRFSGFSTIPLTTMSDNRKLAVLVDAQVIQLSKPQETEF